MAENGLWYPKWGPKNSGYVSVGDQNWTDFSGPAGPHSPQLSQTIDAIKTPALSPFHPRVAQEAAHEREDSEGRWTLGIRLAP